MLVQLSVFCTMLIVINADVKIEVTRLKEPAKPVTTTTSSTTTTTTVPETQASLTENRTSIVNSPSTNMPSTPTTTTQSTINILAIPVTITPIAQANYSNSTANSTLEISGLETTTMVTILPTDLNSKTTANGTLNYTLTAFNTTSRTIAPNILTEFTRRQLRRKLIPPDYYCPCDLKVKNISLKFFFNSIIVIYKIYFVDKLL